MRNLDFSVAYWGFEPERDTCICVDSGPLARMLMRQAEPTDSLPCRVNSLRRIEPNSQKPVI